MNMLPQIVQVFGICILLLIYGALCSNMGHYGASYRQFILPTKKATKLNVGQQIKENICCNI